MGRATSVAASQRWLHLGLTAVAAIGMCCQSSVRLPLPTASAFVVPSASTFRQQPQTPLFAAASDDTATKLTPQAVASGHSQNIDLVQALQEATEMAKQALPSDSSLLDVDLAIVSISSLYSSSPSTVIPTVTEVAKPFNIKNLIGCTNGGFISSSANLEYSRPSTGSSAASATSSSDGGASRNDAEDLELLRACRPIEEEGVPGVSVVLSMLPDVDIQTFHVIDTDVPDDYGRVPKDDWKAAVGLSSFQEKEDSNSAFMLLPSPAFQNDVDDLLGGLGINFPNSRVFGAIASTVSSLSRARLFRYQQVDGAEPIIQTLADGCVGIAMTGDIEIQSMLAQGAKPVGGVYQIVKGGASTIQSIVLDETATELVQQAEAELTDEADGAVTDDDDDDEDEQDAGEMDARTKMRNAYAKARIPKPVLAEANFLMNVLSDDDQAFMRKALLIGLERAGSVGRSPSDLIRLSEGKGHRFQVRQVASAGMKDGSVTFPLGSVEVEPGTRLRFYVREGDFAKREVEALWMGYKRRLLEESMQSIGNDESEDDSSNGAPFVPSACLMFPTLDRGSKFFLGKGGFESKAVSEFVPNVPCINGFFSNGVIGALGLQGDNGKEPVSVQGSSTGYVLIGSKSGRPVYSPAKAAADAERKADAELSSSENDENDNGTDDEADSPSSDEATTKKLDVDTIKNAPRDENGELIIKRREVHSGRALTVSTVEWSVAEKTAKPTSALEGFMWDKETEVDRLRERVPLANLLSQCKLFTMDPTKPKPRDWFGPIREEAAANDGKLVIIPECKRMEPSTGSLRKRYNLSKLIKQYTLSGTPAFSVNCDAVLFGGSLEDVTKARAASTSAALKKLGMTSEGNESENEAIDDSFAPPILASDLLLYPYQLYKLRLAGADAVSLVVGALQAKDLLYLTKIASTMNMQSYVTVTSKQQIKDLSVLSKDGGPTGLIVSNRQLEDFSFDMTGQQALDILRSDELAEFKNKYGDDMPVLVEGRVGIIERPTTVAYLDALQEAGAMAAIVGGGIAMEEAASAPSSLQEFMKSQ